MEANVSDDATRSAVKKFRQRVVPLLFVCQVVGFLDRYNVGFAALQMNASLGLSPTAFGFGAGVFFWGYFVCEIPSAIMLARLGTRAWIARIMVTWGLVCVAMSAVSGPASFYSLRFLLGGAEAGFYPGVLYFLSKWVPPAYRASTVAIFVWSFLVSAIIGGPIAGALLSLEGIAGLEGWRWLFIVEGMMAVVLGCVVMAYLPNEPADVKWLSVTEKTALADLTTVRLHERSLREQIGALRNPTVWLLGLSLFLMSGGLYGINFWLPQILKSLTGVAPITVGFLTAIPYVIGSAAMWWVARHSDRTNERRWHVAVPAVIGAVALVAVSAGRDVVTALIAVSVTMVTYGALPPFWSIATSRLAGPGAATAIATVTSVGVLSGAVGPVLLGASQDNFGSTTVGVTVLGFALVVGALLLWRIEGANQQA